MGSFDSNLFLINSQNADLSSLQTPSGSVSKLDLKAPGKARHEYEKGYQLLLRKDLQSSVDHLEKAIELYPDFVAAHNALGTAYLNLGQSEQARDQFTKAVELDDHLPNSLLNLGCAQLALKQYPAAEESFGKASAIAPLDLTLLKALAYGQYANHDYGAVVATAERVHGRKHEGAALVHFFAAGAWEAQNNLIEAQHEMEVLLQEDPKSPSAEQFRQILSGIKIEQVRQADAKLHPAPTTLTVTVSQPIGPAPRAAQEILQDLREKRQIEEAEAAPEASCVDCGSRVATASARSEGSSRRAHAHVPGAIRAEVDEVAIFFAATDHGKSVTDLTAADVGVSDNSQPPRTVLGFRNESELPLRLGLVIDTSDSTKERLGFEQAAATKFLEKVATGKDDLAFVVGVNNSVLLVQDFTADQDLMSRAISQLAPGGGTALWDAVAFAADKLAGRPEQQPVARILVVISDGEDNSSSVTLKQAIAASQRGEVAVYTVSTRDAFHDDPSAMLGDRALRTLSELTGGGAFVPGSVRRLTGSLAELQQVIRGRYLISYKPAGFKRDGRYRAIEVTAQKDGHKYKVFARKGYYASAKQPETAEQ
jgi:VWFA-related protein